MLKLRELVKKLLSEGKTQTEIARQAKVSQATIHKILFTETEHSLEVLRKFSQAFGVSLVELVAEKEEDYHATNIHRTLTQEEDELIGLFQRLDPARRRRLIETAEDMAGALSGSLGRGGGESGSTKSKSASK